MASDSTNDLRPPAGRLHRTRRTMPRAARRRAGPSPDALARRAARKASAGYRACRRRRPA